MAKGTAWKRIEERRERNFRRVPSRIVRTEAAAARFIDEVGLAFLFPKKGVLLPSLLEARLGRRQRGRLRWDEDVERIWGWKDSLAAKRKVFSGKFFRAAPSFISLRLLPAFYRLAGGGEDPGSVLSTGGKSRPDETSILQTLLVEGPTPRIALRKAAGFDGKEGGRIFGRAIDSLQRDLRVAKVGVADEGGSWPSQVYEAFPRAYHGSAARAQKMSPDEARRQILGTYLDASVAISVADAAKVLRWSRAELEGTFRDLLTSGEALDSVEQGALPRGTFLSAGWSEARHSARGGRRPARGRSRSEGAN